MHTYNFWRERDKNAYGPPLASYDDYMGQRSVKARAGAEARQREDAAEHDQLDLLIASLETGTDISRWKEAAVSIRATFTAEELSLADAPSLNPPLAADGYADFFDSGRLVTVEGTDGVGKTTFVENFASSVKAEGREIVVLREPGGTELSERVRAIFKGQCDEFQGELTPEAQFLLFSVARTNLLKEKVVPLLSIGTSVLLDRYFHSSFVYQGEIGGLGAGNIRNLTRGIIGDCTPDVTLLLDMPPEDIWERKVARGEGSDTDINDPESVEALTAVRSAYAKLLDRDPNMVRVDADQIPDKVVRSAKQAIDENAPDLVRKPLS